MFSNHVEGQSGKKYDEHDGTAATLIHSDKNYLNLGWSVSCRKSQSLMYTPVWTTPIWINRNIHPCDYIIRLLVSNQYCELSIIHTDIVCQNLVNQCEGLRALTQDFSWPLHCLKVAFCLCFVIPRNVLIVASAGVYNKRRDAVTFHISCGKASLPKQQAKLF